MVTTYHSKYDVIAHHVDEDGKCSCGEICWAVKIEDGKHFMEKFKAKRAQLLGVKIPDIEKLIVEQCAYVYKRLAQSRRTFEITI